MCVRLFLYCFCFKQKTADEMRISDWSSDVCSSDLRFMYEGVDGLFRDKSRPPGKAPVPPERVAEIVRLTQKPPPHEATHWTLRAMAKVAENGSASCRERVCQYGSLSVVAVSLTITHFPDHQ